jgi:hypothetical protein
LIPVCRVRQKLDLLPERGNGYTACGEQLVEEAVNQLLHVGFADFVRASCYAQLRYVSAISPFNRNSEHACIIAKEVCG